MLALLIRLFAILILSILWANYVLLKLGVYTRTLRKHQVVRDLKKFENHCIRITAFGGCVCISAADTELISSCSRFTASELRCVLRGKEW